MSNSAPLSRKAGSWICSNCRQLRQDQLRWRPVLQQRRHATGQAAPSSRRDAQKLPDTPARTRFAPSPTGFLHLGSLRTALYNYLIAKATKGQFLLRIEDTDTKRTIDGAEERICSDLQWAGLQWDEGPQVGGPYGPYKQSERTQIYQEHAEKLLADGSAYRCFCTADRLHALATQRAALGLPTDYDRTCLGIGAEESADRAARGETFTVRLKVPETYPEYHDLVYGRVGNKSKKAKTGATRKHGETVYEDPILVKSDGLPTYHLANVVDDHLMRITHVVRAAEWMPSTPKHLALYQAFGWEPPAFAHVGLLQDAQGNKLSKRNADIDLGSYRDRHIFPEALLNFAALLGWSHTRGDDVMELRELVDDFTLKFTRGNTLVTFKKLDYLQRQHGRRYIAEGGERYRRIVADVLAELKTRRAKDENWSLLSEDEDQAAQRARVEALLAVDARKSGYESAARFLDAHQALFVREIERSERSLMVINGDELYNDEFVERLRAVEADKWDVEHVQAVFDLAVEEMVPDGIDKGYFRNCFSKYMRNAVFDKPGPPIVESLALLGRDVTLDRLAQWRQKIKILV